MHHPFEQSLPQILRLEDKFNLEPSFKIEEARKQIRKISCLQICWRWEKAEMADLMKEKYAHPYDLSGGQQQMAALVKVLLADPEILLLDEPTKGMDREHSRRFGELLQKLADEGRTIFMVSHDLEFCAEYADRIGMMFDGKIEGIGEPSELQFTL